MPVHVYLHESRDNVTESECQHFHQAGKWELNM